MVAFSLNLRLYLVLLIFVISTFCVLKIIFIVSDNSELVASPMFGDILQEPTDDLPLFSRTCFNGLLQQGWNDLKRVLVKTLDTLETNPLVDYKPDLQGFGEIPPFFNDILRSAMEMTRSDVFIILEIGSFKGKSTVHLAQECNKMAAKLYKICVVIAIDVWLGTPYMFEKEDDGSDNGVLGLFDTFYNNMRHFNLTNTVFPLRLPSNMAAHVLHCFRIAVDIIYVNGDHEYEMVLRDLKVYYPLVRKNGFMFGDDINSNWPGVDKAVIEFAKMKQLLITPKRRFWVLEKTDEDATFFRM